MGDGTAHRRPHRGGRGGYEPRVVVRTRETRVTELATRGYSQREIAAEVGVSQVAVGKILRRVEDRLLATLHRERVRLLARLYARTELVYRQAQEGWERSCADRQRRTQRRIAPENGTGVERTVVQVSTESQSGDPRFLRTLLSAVAEQRATFNLSALDWAQISQTLEDQVASPSEPGGDEEES